MSIEEQLSEMDSSELQCVIDLAYYFYNLRVVEEQQEDMDTNDDMS